MCETCCREKCYQGGWRIGPWNQFPVWNASFTRPANISKAALDTARVVTKNYGRMYSNSIRNSGKQMYGILAVDYWCSLVLFHNLRQQFTLWIREIVLLGKLEGLVKSFALWEPENIKWFTTDQKETRKEIKKTNLPELYGIKIREHWILGKNYTHRSSRSNFI